MAEYRTINVDPETYDRINRLAERSHRTIGGQVAVLVEFFEQMNGGRDQGGTTVTHSEFTMSGEAQPCGE